MEGCEAVNEFIVAELVIMYRQECGATWRAGGLTCCSYTGPPAFSPIEATKAAEFAGWQWIEDRLVCPVHARAYRDARRER
jgi:hypothetical protein